MIHYKTKTRCNFLWIYSSGTCSMIRIWCYAWEDVLCWLGLVLRLRYGVWYADGHRSSAGQRTTRATCRFEICDVASAAASVQFFRGWLLNELIPCSQITSSYGAVVLLGYAASHFVIQLPQTTLGRHVVWMTLKKFKLLALSMCTTQLPVEESAALSFSQCAVKARLVACICQWNHGWTTLREPTKACTFT